MRVSLHHSTYTYLLQITKFNLVATRDLQDCVKIVHLVDPIEWN